MNKPKDTAAFSTEPAKSTKFTKNVATSQNKVFKNLQMAKDLNREMERMFAEDDDDNFTVSKPAKKGRKKDKRQHVTFD